MRGQTRCAIYTRKSTEEGLEQSFNTLDAQREACEAFVLSQAGEGWEALPELYDDGGWSGGNMDRPALKRLLEDIRKGRINVVVVYKVDRLTRSLMDFSRIVEIFDTSNVSFVSVTQAFNTTSSMGRLTLNVLLSFAQFERDVTGERIRDKIAASKARGMWMGGNIPLGYDLGDRKLLVNETEAETVCHIYRRYLELKSLPILANDLLAQGVLTKRWTSRQSVTHGGVAFNCSGLSHILKNQLYRGVVVHKGETFRGEHDAIVGQELFDAVQVQLADNHNRRATRKTRAAACALNGKLFDADGQQMCPSFSYGRGKRMYRYYISECLLPYGRIGKSSNRQGQRLPAMRIEKLIIRQLQIALPEPVVPDVLFSAVTKVVAGKGMLSIWLDSSPFVSDHFCSEMLLGRVQEHIDKQARQKERRIHFSIEIPPARKGRTAAAQVNGRFDREACETIADLVRTSHRKLAELDASPLDPDRHNNMRAPNNEWTRLRISVGLLAPDIQKALLQGTIPEQFDPDLLLTRKIPLEWNEQRKLFGMAA